MYRFRRVSLKLILVLVALIALFFTAVRVYYFELPPAGFMRFEEFIALFNKEASDTSYGNIEPLEFAEIVALLKKDYALGDPPATTKYISCDSKIIVEWPWKGNWLTTIFDGDPDTRPIYVVRPKGMEGSRISVRGKFYFGEGKFPLHSRPTLLITTPKGPCPWVYFLEETIPADLEDVSGQFAPPFDWPQKDL